MKVWLVNETYKDWIDDVDIEDMNPKVIGIYATEDLAKKYVEEYIEEYFSEEEGEFTIETYEDSTYIKDEVNDALFMLVIEGIDVKEE